MAQDDWSKRHIYGTGPCACERCAKVPELGDRYASNGVWDCISTGGNCTAWSRFAYDAAPAVRWLITEAEEATAPNPRNSGKVTLSLEGFDGTLLISADCASFRAATVLAARFGFPS